MKTTVNKNSSIKIIAIIGASIMLFAGIPITKYAKSIQENLAKPITV